MGGVVKAKRRRELERIQRLLEAGGEPDYERSAPTPNQRQNREFAAATRGLTREEAERLHREISGQALPFAELSRRAKQIMVERKK
jgi:hypothetical protein